MAKKSCCVLPFIAGFVAALIIGWWGFPKVLYSENEQPIQFSHPVHVEEQGMECEQCHTYREDGSYAGLPSTESCAECHADVQGENSDEVRFVEEYVNEGEYREVPWLVYQKQPDNVYFSHAAHKELDCTECHIDVASMDKLPPMQENRLTGYSSSTMKMWQCERCHAQSGASNACYVCHK